MKLISFESEITFGMYDREFPTSVGSFCSLENETAVKDRE